MIGITFVSQINTTMNEWVILQHSYYIITISHHEHSFLQRIRLINTFDVCNYRSFQDQNLLATNILQVFHKGICQGHLNKLTDIQNFSRWEWIEWILSISRFIIHPVVLEVDTEFNWKLVMVYVLVMSPLKKEVLYVLMLAIKVSSFEIYKAY